MKINKKQSNLQIIRNEKSSKKLLEWALEGNNAEILESLRNPSCPSEAYDILLEHKSAIIRAEVAMNKKSSLESLQNLVKDKDVVVRDQARFQLSTRELK